MHDNIKRCIKRIYYIGLHNNVNVFTDIDMDMLVKLLESKLNL